MIKPSNKMQAAINSFEKAIQGDNTSEVMLARRSLDKKIANLEAQIIAQETDKRRLATRSAQHARALQSQIDSLKIQIINLTRRNRGQ